MNELLYNNEWNNEWALPAAGILLLVIVIALIVHRRSRARDPEQRLRSAAADFLAGFIIPNGDEGEIHVEYALLTQRGIVIVVLKDVEGNVFGSDSMQDWTVISHQRRFTFSNPQYALYDRLAAVKRAVSGIPVTGHIAFLSHSHFNKGRPSNVILLDKLIDELKQENKSNDHAILPAWLPQWDLLRETAVTTQVDHLMKS